jgi:hypothetical protein
MRVCLLLNFFKDQIKICRCVGRNDFDEAIRIISTRLVNSERDVPWLEMIALCHHWAERDDMAITTAIRALMLDPHSFDAIELLTRIHASRNEHATVAKYVPLGLENFPSPLPNIPRFYFRLLRFFGFFAPRFKRLAQRAEVEILDPNQSRTEWYAWAKEYLTWYDQTHDGNKMPTVH